MGTGWDFQAPSLVRWLHNRTPPLLTWNWRCCVHSILRRPFYSIVRSPGRAAYVRWPSWPGVRFWILEAYACPCSSFMLDPIFNFVLLPFLPRLRCEAVLLHQCLAFPTIWQLNPILHALEKMPALILAGLPAMYWHRKRRTDIFV